MLDIVSRAAWGARPPKAPYTRLADSEGILAHHLGDGRVRNPATTDYAAVMRETQNFHMNTRGWNDFAYGFGVGGGRIYMGRGFGWIDGADTDRGRVMHSVLWLGDSYKNAIPDEDMALIWALFDEHNRIYGRGFEGGHRDVNATGCPGDSIYNRLMLGRPAAPAPTPTPTPQEDDMPSPLFTATNAAGVPITFMVEPEPARRLVCTWHEPLRQEPSPWTVVVPGLENVLALGVPLVNGPAIWVPVVVGSGFGPIPMTLIQPAVSAPWEAHTTVALTNFLRSL